MMKILEPMGELLMERLKRSNEPPASEKYFLAWNAQTASLMEYRKGNDSASLEMEALSLTYDCSLPSRNAAGNAYNVNTTSNDFDFDGQIDEVWILDEAADATTVNNLYTLNAIPEPSALLLFGAGGKR